MSTNFPTSLDVLANPAASDGLPGHAAQHANANDAIEAQLQAELLQQQVEELDVAYIMFMLAVHA